MKAFIKNFIFIFLSATLFISCSKSNNAPEEKKLDPLEIAITPEIQKQIIHWANRVAPLYNKGGLQVITDGTDVTTIGSKSRR